MLPRPRSVRPEDIHVWSVWPHPDKHSDYKGAFQKKGGFRLIWALWNAWHVLEETSLLEEMNLSCAEFDKLRRKGGRLSQVYRQPGPELSRRQGQTAVGRGISGTGRGWDGVVPPGTAQMQLSVRRQVQGREISLRRVDIAPSGIWWRRPMHRQLGKAPFS